MTLISIRRPGLEKPEPADPSGHALLALGFRPFYLLAAAFAAISVPLWLASYYGRIPSERINLAWHVHEMLYGFVIAVVIGFLYTAGRNWTGLWTPRGKPLAALALLWIAGRLAMLLAPAPVAALVDFAFLPAAAIPLYLVLKRSDNRRNMFMIVLLGMLAAANAAYHLSVLGELEISPLPPIHAAIVIIVLMETVIGGRVIPMFTANAVPGTTPNKNKRRDRICLGFTAMAGIAWTFTFPAPLVAALAIGAAATQIVRLAGWQPWRTLRHPLLWILHLSYAWIPLGFLALALSQLRLAPVSAAVHLLAVGAIAGLVVGMITRTALGHTGRMLHAGKAETAMYGLIQAGVVARFLAAIDLAGLRDASLVFAAGCWSAAFIAYVATYGPYLFRPRVDGKAG